MSDAPEQVFVFVHEDDEGMFLELIQHDAASDKDTAYTRSDLCITRAEADAMVAAERLIWTQAIETYFDATAVMDVETHVERIRARVKP